MSKALIGSGSKKSNKQSKDRDAKDGDTIVETGLVRANAPQPALLERN